MARSTKEPDIEGMINTHRRGKVRKDKIKKIKSGGLRYERNFSTFDLNCFLNKYSIINRTFNA